ncbi:imelysin family protein [Flavobacterium sp. MFBS3-15]|uniref:imelysin family protein n=1 Tax=Flavobacterium sp. MFBS3-15 TaxID=2989816 RepID=UPI0022356C1D|nr:imelysin family protein [Flavobacterium sp. MFBS3-15]MCW4467597.1 imelysin family protein [Flavobacterium sp. MFBS3-15]
MRNTIYLLFIIFFAAAGCSSSDNDKGPEGTYDRSAMMASWADNIIIPSFSNYQAKLNALHASAQDFSGAPSQQSLEALRSAWLDAYKAYQHVGIYDDPKAYELHLIESSNTYPADVAGINNNIATGNYNLSQPAQYAREGFPALDYLLYGVQDSDEAIVTYYAGNANAREYMTDLTAHLKNVADGILADWNGSYRDTFISGTGTAVSAPINQTVNNFVKNLEKDVRTPKLAIPAGKFSNGATLPDKVEAYYRNNVSKELLVEALTASRNFFNGKYFNSQTMGPGLKGYLDAVHAGRNGQNLSDIINAQYDAAIAAANQLNNSFGSQIATDNSKMLAAYDALQQVVVYEKLDMLQALNISIDYVDGDGD